VRGVRVPVQPTSGTGFLLDYLSHVNLLENLNPSMLNRFPFVGAHTVQNVKRLDMPKSLKRQSHKISGPQFFSLNGTPDSWAKAVLNIDSNWPSNSIQFFLLDNAKLNFILMPYRVVDPDPHPNLDSDWIQIQ
jgi:hypothetical protein